MEFGTVMGDFLDQAHSELSRLRKKFARLREKHCPKLTEEDVIRARCLTCDKHLSHGPIHVDQDGDRICGRCTEFVKQPQNRDIGYETSAKHVRFPCIFACFGCDETIRFRDVPEHEATCNYRAIECPVSECDENELCVQVIKQHFVEQHPQNVIENSRFTLFPLDENLATNAILNVKGLSVLLQIRPYTKRGPGKYHFALAVFTRTPETHNLKYGLNMRSEDGSRTLTVDLPQFELYRPQWKSYPERTVLSVDRSTLRSLLGTDRIVCKVLREKQPTPSVNPWIRPECMVCAHSLERPIHICEIGHSVCGQCRNKLDRCPSCRSRYGNGRNYQLEDLIESAMTVGSEASSTSRAD